MSAAISLKDLIFLLVLKVGVAASMAAMLARSATFRRVLYTEMRNSDQKVQLLLFLAPALSMGVYLRLVGYRFADLMLEGSFLLGIVGGSVTGSIGGAIVSLPAFFNHEWVSTPLACGAGALGGLIRYLLPNKELIWNFGPFTFLGLPRWMYRLLRDPRIVWEMLPLAAAVGVELGRIALSFTVWNKYLFTIGDHKLLTLFVLVISTMIAVSVPIKIWNTTRLEAKLVEHERILLNARMAALASQINPHFLFNTLNTVSSLIRFDPDTARVVVLKLSRILRRLLRKQENFVPLRDELKFIDDYLDIEVVRFGREKLQFIKELSEETLDAFVPSMLLQPIVENSIKHGLASKVDGGEIRIRTSRHEGRMVIEIEDNGVGIPADRMPEAHENGIGINNVHERLRVLYGDDFRFDIHSQQGKGTYVRIEFPEVESVLQTTT